jgi:hypothetical protein
METIGPRRKRPDFLTVICILSLLSSIFGIMSNLNSYSNADTVSELTRERLEMSREEAMGKMKTTEQKGMVEKMFLGANELLDTRKQKQSALFNVMANVLTLIGAGMMFNLRRSGFGVYALGIAVWVATPLLIFGVDNYMGIGMAFMLGIIGGLFLILYRRKLKHMG